MKEHLSLEDAIKSKIKLFNELLGEDIKYLSPDEQISTFSLYEYLMSANDIQEDEEGINSLTMSYLQEILKIKKEDGELFDRIRNLPDKIKVARYSSEGGLISFIKKGNIKTFYYTDKNQKVRELEFEEAIQKIKSTREEINLVMPSDYYSLLKSNLGYFQTEINNEILNNVVTKNRTSKNEKLLKNYLNLCAKSTQATLSQKEKISMIKNAYDKGTLNNKIAKDIINGLKGIRDEKDLISKLIELTPEVYLRDRSSYKVQDIKQEESIVILSEYLVNGEDKIEEIVNPTVFKKKL